jgi:hypothetical protein
VNNTDLALFGLAVSKKLFPIPVVIHRLCWLPSVAGSTSSERRPVAWPKLKEPQPTPKETDIEGFVFLRNGKEKKKPFTYNQSECW